MQCKLYPKIEEETKKTIVSQGQATSSSWYIGIEGLQPAARIQTWSVLCEKGLKHIVVCVVCCQST